MRTLVASLLALSSLHAQGVPEGLSTSDWSSIRAAYDAGRHKVFAVESGHQARCPSQLWTVRFDGRGVAVHPDAGGWTWGLELASYGFAGGERSVAAPESAQADGQRLSYRWSDALDEWYENGPGGLEHGYTLHARPEGDGTLTLLLRVRGGLLPTVQNNGGDVAFQRDGETMLGYTGLHVFDADGKTLPARFTVQPRGLLLSIDERGARYPVTVDPIAQHAYLKASNTGTNDEFGRAVAVSGDTVVVGAYGEASNATGINGNQADNSASYAGAAYVFVRSGATWTQQAYLKASNTAAGDQFGLSVAVQGDTVVVGASEEDGGATGVNGNQADNSASGSGAVFVFVRSGGTWTQQAYLKASNTGVDDRFGGSVTISGDTVVVGAYRENSNATGINGNQANNSASFAGAAYVFVRSGTTWTQQAYVKASNNEAGDRFGWSVSLSGDTLVAGAWGESSNATGVNGNQANNSTSLAGAAYVFVRSGTTWTQQAYLKASNTETDDQFGWSISLSGDTVVIGAIFEDSSAIGVNGSQADGSVDPGAAYVFVRSGTTWAQQAYLKASNTDDDDRFGWTVALSGETLVVGAYGEDSSASGVNGAQADNSNGDAGAAYVFVRGGTTWTQHAYLKASNPGNGDRFGYAVAMSGDTVVVGANMEDSSATGINGGQFDNSASLSGSVYVFDLRSGGVGSIPSPVQQAYLKASNTEGADGFGHAVAASGDTVVVGTPNEDSNATGVNGNQADNGANFAGAAYVFVRSGSTWTQQAYLKASNTGDFDEFGAAVAVSGDTIVVGAPGQHHTLLPGEGAAYVFVRTGATWTQQAFLKASNGIFSDLFGESVAVSGDTIVVGAPEQGHPPSLPFTSGQGAAYVFVRSGGTWTQQAFLKASNAGNGDGFGSSVAVSGDTFVAGAPREGSNATGVNGNQADNSAAWSGAAYVFVRSGSTWTQQAYLKASNTGGGGSPFPLGDFFGGSVAVSEDAIVVGAPGEDSNATGVNGDQTDNSASESGAAYLFVRSGPTWSQQAYLKASNTEGSDAFGTSVAMSGNTVVVGAGGEDSNAAAVDGNQADNTASNAGAAYVFSRCGMTWTQRSYLKASNTNAGDSFGVVAVSGDTVVVGAPGEDSIATGVNGNEADNSLANSGAAYVFSIARVRPSLWPLNVPQIGQNYTLAIDNIHPIFNLAILSFGFVQFPLPGLDLGPILGTPCCDAYETPDILITANIGAAGSTSWTWTPVAGTPGTLIYCQALCLDPAANNFGFTISNAITIELVP